MHESERVTRHTVTYKGAGGDPRITEQNNLGGMQFSICSEKEFNRPNRMTLRPGIIIRSSLLE